jgi:hypothetical protein
MESIEINDKSNFRIVDLPNHCGKCLFHKWEDECSECTNPKCIPDRYIAEYVAKGAEEDLEEDLEDLLLDWISDQSWWPYNGCCGYFTEDKDEDENAKIREECYEHLIERVKIAKDIRKIQYDPVSGTIELNINLINELTADKLQDILKGEFPRKIKFGKEICNLQWSKSENIYTVTCKPNTFYYCVSGSGQTTHESVLGLLESYVIMSY